MLYKMEEKCIYIKVFICGGGDEGVGVGRNGLVERRVAEVKMRLRLIVEE